MKKNTFSSLKTQARKYTFAVSHISHEECLEVSLPELNHKTVGKAQLVNA